MLNKKEVSATSPKDLRILVAAEDSLARGGLAALISGLSRCRVVGQTPGDEKILGDIELYRPDIVVWDLGPDPARALDRLEDLRSSDIPIVVLVSGEGAASAACVRGARGILTREVEDHTLLSAMRSVAEGLATFDSHFAGALFSARGAIPEQLAEPLTPRESEVLQRLASGLPNKSIAVQMGISEHTVKFHVNSILSKLQAQSRTEAVNRGIRLGLIKL